MRSLAGRRGEGDRTGKTTLVRSAARVLRGGRLRAAPHPRARSNFSFPPPSPPYARCAVPARYAGGLKGGKGRGGVRPAGTRASLPQLLTCTERQSGRSLRASTPPNPPAQAALRGCAAARTGRRAGVREPSAALLSGSCASRAGVPALPRGTAPGGRGEGREAESSLVKFQIPAESRREQRGGMRGARGAAAGPAAAAVSGRPRVIDFVRYKFFPRGCGNLFGTYFLPPLLD